MSDSSQPGIRARLADRISRLGSLLRHKPHVLLVPCVLFIVIVGTGLYGVIQAHKDSIADSRKTAAVEAESASQAFQNMLQKAALPLKQIAELVPLMPTKAAMQKQWDVSAPSWWLGTLPGTIYIGLTPLGVFDYLVFTPVPTPLNQENSIGIDLLGPPWREKQLQTIIPNKRMTFSGPITEVPGIVFCVLEVPIYISNVSVDERWGHTMKTSYCPPEICYNNVTRTKWWGNVNAGIDVSWLLGVEGPLSILARKGYKYQLWQPPMPGLDSAVAISLSGAAESEPDSILITQIPVIDQTWELHLWMDSWATPWILPLAAVVVLGALIVSALVFSTLRSWEEHRILLHSLLPKETIDRMRHEARWASAHDEDALRSVRLETPAEIMMRIIDDNLADRTAPVTLLLAVRDALQRSADVYRPTAKQMQDRMNALEGMDDDVRKALTAQLIGATMNDRSSGHSSRSGNWSSVDPNDLNHTDSTVSPPPKGACTKLSLDMGHLQDCLDTATHNNPTYAACPIKAVHFATEPAGVEHSSLARQLAAYVPLIVTGSGLSEESGLVLSRWVLMAPEVAGLVMTPVSPAALEIESAPFAASGDALPTAQAGPGSAVAAAGHVQGTATSDCVHGEVRMVAVMKPILSKLERVLVEANEWGFDAFALDEASHGHPLSCLGFWLLHTTGLKSWARMSTKKLVAFLEVVEAGYTHNPYHNRRHAADVLQSVHVIMNRSGMTHDYADQLTTLGCYMAAMVHDFEHVGCTNDFLINSSDTLAVRYNDRSPMENHHLAAAWELLKTREYNILGNLPKSEVVRLRKLMIDLVLATDMKQHFAIQGQFETLHRPALDAATSHRGSHRLSRAASGKTASSCGSIAAPEDSATARKPLNEQDKLISLQMMFKCADLGHIAAPLPVHLKWVSALESEFFLQGDKEKDLGLPVSPLCDRTKEGVTKSQLGFFDFVVLPLFKSFSSRFAETGPMLKAVMNNLNHWKSVTQPSSSHDRKTPDTASAQLGKLKQHQ